MKPEKSFEFQIHGFESCDEIKCFIDKIQNIITNTNLIIVYSETSLARLKKSEDNKDDIESSIKEIFDYWQTIMSREKSAFSKDREKKIRLALDSFSTEAIKNAILGCSYSDFHMGRDKRNLQGIKYNEITLILRNPEKIEFFLNIYNSKTNIGNNIDKQKLDFEMPF